MIRKLILFFSLIITTSIIAQTEFTGVSQLKGRILDSKSNTPLPYANIYVLNKHRGVISNEAGYFSLNTNGLSQTDSIKFQYIGYKTRTICLVNIKDSSDIFLEEEMINLSETLIFGSTPNLKQIVKKVIENKENNYKKTTSVSKVFVRRRENTDIENFNLDMKKTSFEELDEKMVQTMENALPKNSISYTDFMGDVYFSAVEEDSIKFKTNPIRTVSLKEKDIAELDQLEKVFDKLLSNTAEEEYWKIKSGVFGQKLDIDANDTTTKKENTDTTDNNQRRLKYFNYRIAGNLKYSNMDDEKLWEFLYKPARYKYTLAGGISVGGEPVYIIDFEPASRGLYKGRMYISIETYALIKADYEYAEGKNGRDLSLLGVSFSEDHFKGSVFFQKKDSVYKLKYFSKSEGSSVGFDRSVALLKKKKRWLFDKKLNEIKVGVDLGIKSQSLVEFLILDYEEISHSKFANFIQPEKMDVIYVEQFNDSLWKDFSIIEPTVKMREYRKQTEY